MKTALRAAAAWLFFLAWLPSLPVNASTANINPQTAYQTIEGFGGAIAFYNGWVSDHPSNGVLAGITNGAIYPLSAVINNYSFINRSLYSSDPYVNLTINEFRIYNGPLSSADVALNQALGPDVLAAPTLSVTIVGSNVVVSWPTNYSGFTLVSQGSLGAGGSWNPVGTSPVISGVNYQVTLPATNTARVFRLSK